MRGRQACAGTGRYRAGFRASGATGKRRSLRLFRKEQRNEERNRGFENRQFGRRSHGYDCRHARKEMMAANMPEMILVSDAVVLVGRAVVMSVRMRLDGVTLFRGKARQRGERAGHCLHGKHKQQHNHGEFFVPSFHERGKSIENPQGMQSDGTDSRAGEKFEDGIVSDRGRCRAIRVRDAVASGVEES